MESLRLTKQTDVIHVGEDEALLFLFLPHTALLPSNVSAPWQDEDAGVFETDKAAPDGGNNRLLIEILQHFPPAQCIEALRSVCRRAVASAVDCTGLRLHKVGRSAKPILSLSI